MPLFGPPDVEKLKAKRNVNGLVKALRYMKDPTIRQAAAQALIDIGEGSKALDASLALSKLGDARSFEPLIVLLNDQDYEYGRWKSARALGELKDQRAIQPLIVALTDKYKSVRSHAAGSLKQLGWKPDKSAAGAAFLLASSKSPTIGDFGRSEVNWDKCVEIGTDAVGPLILYLDFGDDNERRSSARVLGKIGDPRAVSHLMVALNDTNIYFTEIVATALGEIGAPAVRPLIYALMNKKANVRWDAARALGNIGDKRAVEPLMDALKDEHKSVRRIAIEALGNIGDDRAVEPLIATLKDEDVDVRKAVADALGNIGDKRAMEPLLNNLYDENLPMRVAVVEALDSLGWSPDKNRIGADYWIVKQNWDECAQIGVPAVEPLIAALNDEDTDVREGATEALGQIGEPVVGPLIAALKSEDLDVREGAAKALVAIHNSGRLGAKDKNTILAQEDEIKRIGENTHEDRTMCIYHDDFGRRGFHVDFSL